MTEPEGPGSSLLTRLRRRKLVQWALAYLAGAWLVMQLVDVVGGRWGWSDTVGRMTDVILVAGLAVTIVIAAYHGERGQQRVTGVELLILAAILVLAGAGVTWVGGESARSTSKDGAPAVHAAAPNSIAVLPFVNMSSDPEQDYFSEGLAEELLNILTRIPDLRVTARTSSFAFGSGTGLTATEIAARLGVARIVEGSVRKAGGQVRITVQVIDARTDSHLLSEAYDRELTPTNILEVQEEIARSVAELMKLRMGTEEEVGGTSSTEAYDLYLHGLYAARNSVSEADQRRAIGLFEAATDLDPDFAQAYAAEARSWTWMADAYLAPVDALSRARDAGERALAAADLPEARIQLAYIEAILGWNSARGLATLDSIIAAHPNDASALVNRALVAAPAGRTSQALADADRARRLDPLNPATLFVRGWTLIMAGDLEGALENRREVQDIAPDLIYGEDAGAIALRKLGRLEDALEIYDSARRVTGEDPFAGRAVTLYGLGRTVEAEAERTRLEEQARRRYVSPALRGWVDLVMGHEASGFARLSEAVEAHDAWLSWVPKLDGIEGYVDDPRFVAILERAGLAPLR